MLTLNFCSHLFRLCLEFRRSIVADFHGFFDWSDRVRGRFRAQDYRIRLEYLCGLWNRQCPTIQWRMCAELVCPLCTRAILLRPHSQPSSQVMLTLHCLLSSGLATFFPHLFSNKYTIIFIITSWTLLFIKKYILFHIQNILFLYCLCRLDSLLFN